MADDDIELDDEAEDEANDEEEDADLDEAEHDEDTLAVEPDELDWRPTPGFRRLVALPVAW